MQIKSPEEPIERFSSKRVQWYRNRRIQAVKQSMNGSSSIGISY